MAEAAAATETPASPEAQPEASPPPEADPGASTTTIGESAGAVPAPDDAGGGDTAGEEGTWPANWRDIMAGGDDKSLRRLNRFANPVNLYKSWASAQQKIGSGELLRSKPQGEEVTDEQLNQWRGEAGIPSTPEGYLEKLPGGLVIGEHDQPIVDDFIKAMHDADSPPEYVHQALQWHYAYQDKMEAERAQLDADIHVKAEDELRADYGPEYTPNLNNVRNMFDTYGAPGLLEEFFSARMADGTLLGDHVGVLRLFVDLSREINPVGFVSPAEGKTAVETIAEEKRQLEALMADDHSAYWKGPEAKVKQARYRELLEMEERYNSRAA